MKNIPDIPDKMTTGKIDIDIAVSLRKSGHSLQQIADKFGVARQSVHEALRKVGCIDLDRVKLHKEHLSDILAMKENMLLSSLTEESLKKLNGQQLAVTFGILFDKRRLEEGKSTANVSTMTHFIKDACIDS